METHYGNYHETTTATVSEYETVVSYFQKVVFVPFFFFSLGGMCQAVISLGNVQGNNKNFLFFTALKNSGKDVAFYPLLLLQTYPPHPPQELEFQFPLTKKFTTSPTCVPPEEKTVSLLLKMPEIFLCLRFDLISAQHVFSPPRFITGKPS